jgi:putative exporter of polyketide antibiotics
MVKALKSKILFDRFIISAETHERKVAIHAPSVARHLGLKGHNLTRVLIEAGILPAKSTHLKLHLRINQELLGFGNLVKAAVLVLIACWLVLLIEHLLVVQHRQLEQVLIHSLWGLLLLVLGRGLVHFINY